MENTTTLNDLIKDLEDDLMIDSKHTCQICGNHLELFHKTDFVSYKVIETAQCAECGVTLKNKTHTLH